MSELTMGQRIAEQRKKLGISQESLGEKAGVSRQAISKWESDAAIPEVDKLIALSKLFGVSVGWLLGVEEQPAQRDDGLSETQLQMVEQIVKKYQSASHPFPVFTKWQHIAAICMVASIFISLFAIQITNAKQEGAIQSKMDISTYQDLSARVAALEERLSMEPQSGTLLADYTIDVTPQGGKLQDGTLPKAQVTFSAIPNSWSSSDTGYITVRGGSMEPFKTECDWDGSHLSATVALDVADGYELCFVVEHDGGSQEQQILENATIESLTESFSIPLEVTPGTLEYRDGILTMTGASAVFDLPPIYEDIYNTHGIEAPVFVRCEYGLYINSGGPTVQLFDNMRDHLTYTADGHYQVTDQVIQFTDVPVEENTDHLQLWFFLSMTNGLTQKAIVDFYVPDDSGSIVPAR